MEHIYRKRFSDQKPNNQLFIAEQEKDLPGDLRLALDHEDEDLYGIFQEEELAGVAMVCEGDPGFISIYIKPDYRRQGIASFILTECEKQLREQGTSQIMTAHAKEAASFAQKRGYLRQFSSAYMIYTGDKMEIEEDTAFVRQYRDEDYDTVHAFHAKAFHEMRLQVGDFPDSREEEPSEEMRQEWAQTAEERLVYVKGPAIVGYAHMEGCELDGISVDPIWQGQGMGRRFLKCVCNHMIDQGNTEIKLFCVMGNPVRKLYDSVGFEEVAVNEYAMKTLHA